MKIIYLSLALLCSTQSSMGWISPDTIKSWLTHGKSQLSKGFEYAKENHNFSLRLGIAAAAVGIAYMYFTIFYDVYLLGIKPIIVPKGSLCKIVKPMNLNRYYYDFQGETDLKADTKEIIIKNRTGYFAFISSPSIKKPTVQIVYYTNNRQCDEALVDHTANYDETNKTFTLDCDAGLDSRVDYIVRVPWEMRNIRCTAQRYSLESETDTRALIFST